MGHDPLPTTPSAPPRASSPVPSDPDLAVHARYQSGTLDTEAYRSAMRQRSPPQVTATLTMLVPPPGVLVRGDYLVLGELGRGAMGSIRFAKDGLLRRKVAYKRMREDTRFDAASVRRFVAEAQITAQLEHPNIVPIYSVHQDETGEIAYTMKLVDGLTLNQVIRAARDRARRGVPTDEVRERTLRLEHFLRTCDAIAYAHSRGVIHRDLKPANVMVGEYNEVYVMDWGIARLAGPESDKYTAPLSFPGGASPVETLPGEALGTPRYMAPEQALGNLDEIGPATDQYALGLILQELVTLEPAAVGGDLLLALQGASQAKRNPFRHVQPRVQLPAELAAITARATARIPAERYPDVRALADDVRAHLRGEAVAALPDTTLRRLGRWVGRHRERALVGTLAFALVAVLTVGASFAFNVRQASVAAKHERRIIDAQASATQTGAAIEAEMLRFGRLLEGLSAAASIVLSQTEPRPQPVYLATGFDTAGAAPPDRTLSRALAREVSLDHPTFWFPPGSVAAAHDRAIGQLGRLREAMFRTVVRSDSADVASWSDAEQRARVLAEGVPVAGLRLVLEDGIALQYPGQVAPADEDAREASWYRTAVGRRFLHWDLPRREASGPIVVTCSRSVYGEDTRTFLGVAALDVVMGPWLAPRMMPADPKALEAFLLDADGRVLAWSGGAADLLPVPRPAVLAALTAGVVGEVDSGPNRSDEITILTPLRDVGWFYAARFAR